MCKYSHQHLEIIDADAKHCATYAFGETCGHSHVGEWECYTIRQPYSIFPLHIFSMMLF